MKNSSLLLAPCFVTVVGLCGAAAQVPPLTTELVADGFSFPVFACSPPGDTSRIFVLEQAAARIRIIEDSTVLGTPFLDINSKVTDAANETGLLGMAFHPNYGTNGHFYLNYINNSGDTVIERYTVSGDPDVADAGSGAILTTFDQPFSNHNGGMLAFGPDGYLYIGLGDGGDANDPDNRAQDLSDPLGKMLRVDVDSAFPFAIPPDNPFVGVSGADERIWAYGLRNPWRWSFDRTTGDLYIGDVGQGAREEIDYQPASSTGGENYGWKVAEGFACRGGSGTCGTNPGFTPPIYDYVRSDGHSVTGGYVYRGVAIPELHGTYFFADYIFDTTWSLKYDGTSVSEFTNRTAELDPPGVATIESVSSFGEDGNGELLIVDHTNGSVHRLILVDKDRDGLTNEFEETLGTDPENPDTDSDGLSDNQELNAYFTDPLDFDTDDDGDSDGEEITNGTNPLDPLNQPLPLIAWWGVALLLLVLIATGAGAIRFVRPLSR